MIGVHRGAVAAMDQAAIDEETAAAMAADVAQRCGLEYRVRRSAITVDKGKRISEFYRSRYYCTARTRHIYRST
jgi:hypothetical protein